MTASFEPLRPGSGGAGGSGGSKSCSSGYTQCGSVCVQLLDDVDHCGACDTRCGDQGLHGKAICQNGSCQVTACDDGFDASPALVDKEIYLRGQKFLYCIAAP